MTMVWAGYYICGELLHLWPVITFVAKCYYICDQLLHLWPNVITSVTSYYICDQLLHLWPVITFVANCYYICDQLLHLWPVITHVASTGTTYCIHPLCVPHFLTSWMYLLNYLLDDPLQLFLNILQKKPTIFAERRRVSVKVFSVEYFPQYILLRGVTLGNERSFPFI